MNKNSRRGFLRAGAAAAAGAGAAQGQTSAPVKKVHYRGAKPENTPLFSGAVSYGNLLFIAGKGYHEQGDIKVHTKAVLDSVPDEQRTVCHRRRARVMGAAEPHPGGVLILSAAVGAGHVRAA